MEYGMFTVSNPYVLTDEHVLTILTNCAYIFSTLLIYNIDSKFCVMIEI